MFENLVEQTPHKRSKGYFYIVAGVLGVALLVAAVAMTVSTKSVTFLHDIQGLTVHDEFLYDAFKIWMGKFNKTYATNEELNHRFKIFKENFAKVKRLMDEPSEAEFTLSLFSDLSREEFAARYMSQPLGNMTSRPRNIKRLSTLNLPDEIDWKKKGAVSRVKNQGQCGSCWAFSATGSLEGIYAIKKGELINLSNQQLVDCSDDYGNLGCNGGLMDWSFEYVRDKGIEADSDYPYKAATKKCQYDESKVIFKISGYSDVPPEDSEQLAAAVAQQPVSIGVQADTETFQFYKNGVISSSSCGTNINHGILAIGYKDQDEDGNGYWNCKNSWGSSWGNSGYVRIKKSREFGPGICGIALMASYAEL